MINITLTCPKEDSHQCFPEIFHSGGNFNQVKSCIKWIAQYSHFLVVYSLKVFVNKQQRTDAFKKNTRQVTSLKYFKKYSGSTLSLLWLVGKTWHWFYSWSAIYISCFDMARLMYVTQKM